MTSRWIYRVDITGLDSGGASTVFRYATVGYCTSPSHATLPNTAFDGRLKQPLLLRRNLYGQQRTHGSSDIAHGTVEINNPDGGVDALLNYGFDAQTILVYRIDSAAPDTEFLEFRGQMESLTSDGDVITILVRDATYAFDVALQPTKYAGSNSLPGGLEGTANDIKGQPKPICLGTVFNAEPVFVNTSRLIYQIHDVALGTSYSLTAYDKRIALTVGISRLIADFNSDAVSKVGCWDSATNAPDGNHWYHTIDPSTGTAVAHGFTTGMPANVTNYVSGGTTATLPGLDPTLYYYVRADDTTHFRFYPTATDATNNTNQTYFDTISGAKLNNFNVWKNRTLPGCFDWCSDSSGSFIRLGSQAQGKVTMDVTNPVPSSAWYDVLATVLGRLGTFSVDNRISASYNVVGVLWKQEISAYAAIQQILQSVNGSFQLYPNRSTGTYVTTQRVEAPAVSAVLSLDAASVQERGGVKLLQPQDEERGIPPWRINCGYKHNMTVMAGSDVGGAAAADVAFTSLEYRTTQVDTTAVKTQFPRAPELSVDTDLTTETDAQSHGTYLHGTVGTPGRRLYQCSISLDLTDGLLTNSPPTPAIPGLMLAQTVNVTFPRYGLGSGKFLVVLGYVLDLAARNIDLILWG